LRDVRVDEIVGVRSAHWWADVDALLPVSSPLFNRSGLGGECVCASESVGLATDHAVIGVWLSGGSCNVSLTSVRLGRVAALPFVQDQTSAAAAAAAAAAAEHAFHWCSERSVGRAHAHCDVSASLGVSSLRVESSCRDVTVDGLSDSSNAGSSGLDSGAVSIKNNNAYA
jgi:hypothetical protein